jgi:hypothetical protein
VEKWLINGPIDAKAKLAAAKATLSVDDWHHASNLLLEKASRQRREAPASLTEDASPSSP